MRSRAVVFSCSGPPWRMTEPAGVVVCHRCGTTAAGRPLTWSTMVGRDGELLLVCDTCTRANLRAMEARLDEQFW